MRREDDPVPDPAPPELPTSLVPRWLAALVLVALLAAGVLSAWLVLRAPSGASQPPAAEPATGAGAPRPD